MPKITRSALSLVLLFPHLIPASLGLWLLLSISATNLHAAPGLLNFQGRLTDSGNNPRTGSFNMQFKITSGSDGSGVLWSETQNNVPVSNGIFAVNVGASTPIPETVFNTDIAFLEVTVAGEVLLPRQRLLTAPYAFNASRVGGWNQDYFVSTAPVAQTLDGVKTFTSFPIKSGGLTPSSAGEFATKEYVDVFGGPALLSSTRTWTGQQTFTKALTVFNTSFIVTEGNIVLGTIAPNASLNIVGPFHQKSGGANNPFIYRWNITNEDTASYDTLYLYGETASGSGTFGSSIISLNYNGKVGIGYNAGGPFNAKFAVNGSVGIGTASPAVKFEVSSDAAPGGLNVLSAISLHENSTIHSVITKT